ncbi:MAG: Tol-Pal system protein TolB, partial [Alphaproteobacteria bacterium]|nr:Tol-Pal system protein TolB [Alphaproteobacteria bacterium]
MKKLFVLLVLVLFPLNVQAELRIDLTRGVSEPMPVAITTFYADVNMSQDKDLTEKIPQIISENLEHSGLFKSTNSQAFVQDTNSIQKDGIRFGEWRATGTQALVTGIFSKTADGRTRVEFRLWDVFSQKQLIGMAYMTTPQNWRR